MKKFLILTFASVALIAQNASAWGKLGHEIVIKVAERHLTDRAKANIAKYMSYDLKTDAVWMDQHRKDKEIAYTTLWHVYNVDAANRYDPNPRLKKGDAMRGLCTADYNLRHYEELSDSAVVMNLRMILHFVGDMHCPTHTLFEKHHRRLHCTLNGKPEKSFHVLYDKMPQLLYPDGKAEETAANIDNLKKGAIKKCSAELLPIGLKMLPTTTRLSTNGIR